MLDTTAPGTSLTAAKVILTLPSTLVDGMNTLLTPDGTKVVAATSLGGHIQITKYSASTGQPLVYEDQFSPSAGWQDVLWSDPGGHALVVTDPRGKKSQYGHGNIMGVLAGNKFTPIPHSALELLYLAW